MAYAEHKLWFENLCELALLAQRYRFFERCPDHKSQKGKAGAERLDEKSQVVAAGAGSVTSGAVRQGKRRAHSAVESAMNSLKLHGMDMCPAYDIDRIRHYVNLTVVTHNIQRIGFCPEWRNFRSRKRADSANYGIMVKI